MASTISSTGGSRFLLDVCRRGFLQAAISLSVIEEADRNVLEKALAAHNDYRLILNSVPFTIVAAPSLELVQNMQPHYFEDAHVVAAAIATSANFLITLDRNLERRMIEAQAPVEPITPGSFIRGPLFTHADYEAIRTIE